VVSRCAPSVIQVKGRFVDVVVRDPDFPKLADIDSHSTLLREKVESTLHDAMQLREWLLSLPFGLDPVRICKLVIQFHKVFGPGQI
jgi:hypothetical protein